MKVLIYGLGYVGLSLATLLSNENDVVAVDIDEKKIELVNNKVSPIKDVDIEERLKGNLSLRCVKNGEDYIEWADFLIVATPTNYDPTTNSFDTSSVGHVLSLVKKHQEQPTVVIKSTIPIGFCEKHKNGLHNLVFSPEFLREGKALHDNLYPSRIVVGCTSSTKESVSSAEKFANLLNSAALQMCSILTMSSTEAEAVKLFSNTYLALRVSFFNELDTYCSVNKLNTKNIVKAVSLDPRIGDFYNNPSFGYGGYCLPKDTKQLLYEFAEIPNSIIKAIVESNEIRAKFIADEILDIVKKRNIKHVGVYRLIMKAGSDNFRSSAIQNVLKHLILNNVDLIIFEPSFNGEHYENIEVVKDFELFESKCDLIITNRIDSTLSKCSKEIYTKDIDGEN